MDRVTFWLQLLLLVLILRQSAAAPDQCSKLREEINRLRNLNQRHELLVAQCQEQMKTQIDVSEAAFISYKFVEDVCKSKLEQTETVNSVLRKQLEEKEQVMKANNQKQAQLQTTIDGLTKTVTSLNQKAELEHLANQFRVSQDTASELNKTEGVISGLKKQLEAKEEALKSNNEKLEQLQTTIDGLVQTVQSLNQTAQVLCASPQFVCRYLLEAAESGDVTTTRILFRCSNDSCIDEGPRYPLLMFAAGYGHVGVVRVLLEGGANVERASASGYTALHQAALNGRLEVCRLLLDYGAKVDALNEDNNTPLIAAAWIGHLSLVKLLVERGADVSLTNNSGLTASDVARNRGKDAVAEWLDSVGRG